MNILVTGSSGFVGKNIVETLKNIKEKKDNSTDIEVDNIYCYDVSNKESELKEYTKSCDFVIHLAGVNRPENPKEFYSGNKDFARVLCSYLKENNNKSPILVSSSIQVGKDNDYAKSKKEGEEYFKEFSKENGNPVYIYRFPNLFGKWCRPNYNSVVATWCYNIANDKEILISDPKNIIDLCYIDDVIDEIINCIGGKPCNSNNGYCVIPTYKVSLGEIKELLTSFKKSRNDLSIPNQENSFIKKLYATFLSYLPEDKFGYDLKMNIDDRGLFSEFIRTKQFGQVSINISKPGITKGNHWHHTKNEKFLVVSGEGLIQFRKIGESEIIEYHVSGEKLQAIDIPTGYTHNIINKGNVDMVTVMWANEPFDPQKPDTYFEEV